MATVQFATIPQLSLSECVLALGRTAERVQAGDLRDAEALLTVQAVALNSIFVQLALRAEQNIGQYLDAADRYMRLALKAQGQCRATLETLSVIKNPPTVFARQANIAHGPQQVNNSALLIGSGEAASRAGTAELGQSRVLEAHGERLDEGATRTAGACDSPLAPVAVFDRPTDA